ncbi:MAG: CDC27 family protein [Polaribacter sp.]|uniref:CDC27 family protein n=1 Tax=Polaribacter sp. TaxID=1920175 RepID=UPI002F35C912
MYYYLIIGLQIFCVYHAYKNSSNYYWYFIIFFIPLIGCVVYLLTHVINKREVANITDEIVTIINPTKKIKDLEQKLKFSNTFENRVNLGDAFLEIRDYPNAMFHYEKSLKSNFKNDPFTLNKLIKCYFETSDFDKVIEITNKINLDKDFKESIYYYGLALEEKGNIEAAEIQLKKIDTRYSNYDERIEFAKFLIRRDKSLDAKEVLEEILLEIKSMIKQNARKHRYIVSEAEKIMNEI